MAGLGWGGVGLGAGDDSDSPWGKQGDETPAWAGGDDGGGDDGGEIELGEPTRVVEDAPAPPGKDPATGQDLPAWARASASGAAEVEAAVEGEAPAKKKKKKGWFGGGQGEEDAPPVSVEVAISEDLKKRMKELDAREGKLKALEAQLQAGGATLKPVNWPRCLPRLRIAIDEDIAAEMTGLVKAGYVAWLLSIAGYVWNFVCILFLVFVSGQSGVGFGSFFLGTLMSILGLLCSYWFWFKVGLQRCGAPATVGPPRHRAPGLTDRREPSLAQLALNVSGLVQVRRALPGRQLHVVPPLGESGHPRRLVRLDVRRGAAPGRELRGGLLPHDQGLPDGRRLRGLHGGPLHHQHGHLGAQLLPVRLRLVLERPPVPAQHGGARDPGAAEPGERSQHLRGVRDELRAGQWPEEDVCVSEGRSYRDAKVAGARPALASGSRRRRVSPAVRSARAARAPAPGSPR